MERVPKCVGDALMELGISPDLKGFNYLGYGVKLLSINTKDYECRLVKALYVDVAREFGTTASRVERAMRHAIEVGITRIPQDVWIQWFGNTISLAKGTPTNSQMLYTLFYRLGEQITA